MQKRPDQKALKQSMRRYFLQQRTSISPEERVQAEVEICRLLKEMLLTWKVHRIHTYLPMEAEVDVWPLIHWALGAGMEVTVPKTLPGRELKHLSLLDPVDLVTGRFGTQHPRLEIPSEGIYDVVLVPGLAFDKQGNRLGYGAGYYDHFLAAHSEAIKVGICFADQIAEAVPHDSHDVPMDAVVTENGLIHEHHHV